MAVKCVQVLGPLNGSSTIETRLWSDVPAKVLALWTALGHSFHGSTRGSALSSRIVCDERERDASIEYSWITRSSPSGSTNESRNIASRWRAVSPGVTSMRRRRRNAKGGRLELQCQPSSPVPMLGAKGPRGRGTSPVAIREIRRVPPSIQPAHMFGRAKPSPAGRPV
jgi:hypothetical protein